MEPLLLKPQRFCAKIWQFVRLHPYALTFLFCVMLIFLYPESQDYSVLPLFSSPRNWTLAVIPLLIVIGGILFLKKRLTDRKAGLLLCAMGFCLRLSYVLATPYYVRQHDVGRFDGDSGHAFYIAYLYQNLHLPDFDVREVWQFYHPPLHHSIAACWMRLLTSCGVSYEHAGESVQLLTLAYSCICLVIFWNLLKHFYLRGAAFTIPLGIMAFHPTFIMLAGSINNDVLSITFMLASILLTLKWFRRPCTSTILKLALTIGLGMMTKLSVWMAAPAAATAFLIVLYRSRKQPAGFLRQFVVFGAVCIPLGLGWGIRNLIKWGVPLAYVPMLSSSSSQYVGDIPIWQRLLDFSPKQFLYVYDCFEMYGQPYNEYNPLIGLFKTAMFGEIINPEHYPAIRGFGEVLFFSQIVLAGLALAAVILVCRKQHNCIRGMEKALVCLTAGITLISYYSFCLSFAHTCTQNIRYATPLIVIGCLFLGLWMQQREFSAKMRYVILSASGVFMASSFLVYTFVCG